MTSATTSTSSGASRARATSKATGTPPRGRPQHDDVLAAQVHEPLSELPAGGAAIGEPRAWTRSSSSHAGGAGALMQASRMRSHGLFQLGAVVAASCGTVHSRAVSQCRLGRVDMAVVTGPGVQHRRLQRAAVGEAQLPRLGRPPVDARPGARRLQVGLPPERKTIPGTAAGTVRRSTPIVASATCSGSAWTGQSFPGSTMLGLSRVASRTTRWRANCVVHRPESRRRHLGAALDAVRRRPSALRARRWAPARPPGTVPRSGPGRGRWPPRRWPSAGRRRCG